MRLRRFLAAAVALAILAGACGGGTGGTSGTGTTPTETGVKAPDKGVEPASKIVFWHAMGGTNGEAVNKLVADFNSSQSKIQVEAIFQGTYDDALSKLNTALASNSAPAVVQVYDIGQRFMIDSGEIVPVQSFVDRDKFELGDFEPAVLNYYKVEGKLYSMPFNSSSSILYYNKDAFKEAGLDPEKPPKTFEEVTDFAKKLVKKDASGATVRYGFHQSIYGWLFEQYMAVSGGLFADNGNGREKRATKLVFNDEKGKAILDWWKAGVDGGYFWNPGVDNDGSANAFNAGKSAMYVESTARLRGHINATQGKFQVGTGRYPRPANAPATGGNIIGGASVYLMKSRPAAEQNAAWEFLKFCTSPKSQADWQAATGYYPVVKKAYDEPVSKQWATTYPQFLTAVDQIRTAPQNTATAGAVIGVFPEGRRRIQKAIEELLLGRSSSKEALDAAATELNAALEKYNKSTGN
jgi:sn-glycerol 3-phosphate transport system substrate-binding protein